jgi:hypothetical protein
MQLKKVHLIGLLFKAAPAWGPAEKRGEHPVLWRIWFAKPRIRA